MRPLDLHISALNDHEYAFYTASLSELMDQEDVGRDDGYYQSLSVSVREVRAWLRGRFSDIPVQHVDSVLRLFCPNLAQTDLLSGGQFFAALRLVLHVQSGKEVDRAYAFVQFHPSSPNQSPSRPSSPSKRSSQSQPPPLHPDTPIRRLNQVQVHTPVSPVSAFSTFADNPFSPPSNLVSAPQHAVSSTNPFLAHKSLHKPADSNPQKLPPLPPRKPAPPIPLAPPPRHASLILPQSTSAPPSLKTSASAPNHHSPIPQKFNHVTSALMRQSLQASKTAQSLKKAEEELERERVLSILKRSNGGAGSSSIRKGSLSPERTSTSDSTAKVPPLPRRRNTAHHQVPSPPPSSSTTSLSTGSSSLERVTCASLGDSRVDENNSANNRIPFNSFEESPFSPTSPFSNPSTRFSSRPLPDPLSYRASPDRYHTQSASPTRPSADLPHAIHPPPTHPTRHLAKSTSALASASNSSASSSSSFDLINPTPSPSQPTSRMSRSQSLHHPSPPPIPPPRRKRPESVQLTPTPDTVDSSSLLDTTPTRSKGEGSLPRNLSLSPFASSPADKDGDREKTKSASGLTNIQRTIAKFDTVLQPKLALDALQPHLDRARYKAEAGISWRGYLNHHGLASKWVGSGGEEGKEELISAEGSAHSGTSESQEGGDGDGERSEEYETRRDSVDADDLKWPIAEGWKQL